MTGFKTIEWTGRSVRLLDQTLLPSKTKYLSIKNEKEMWEAIKALRVRGAPAIGVAAAYGVYLGVSSRDPRTMKQARVYTEKMCDYLATSRPTAVNLFWALDRCRSVVTELDDDAPPGDCTKALLKLAQEIHRDDQNRCRAIAQYGGRLLKECSGVLTHCNAGALATAGVGTALGVIIEAARLRRRREFVVYADETRPLLQGARLTMWELHQAGISSRLITDSTAGTVLKNGLVQAVIVGADRIAANGDTANKIGTMPLAVVAAHFKVPFYVAAPLSTFDQSIRKGDDIPIEERGSEEITRFGGATVAPKGTETYSPAFDVTPAKLIAGIVTEKGVLRPPYRRSIKVAFSRKGR